MRINKDYMRVLKTGRQLDSFKKENDSGMIVSICLILAGIIILIALPAQASINESQAIRAIIGEASNQGYDGMLAVACAIKNRGTLKGVYGVNAKHIDKQPKWVWDLARKAWKESKVCDVTKGATHWENIKAFGKPYWVKSMVQTYACKDHVFYKEMN